MAATFAGKYFRILRKSKCLLNTRRERATEYALKIEAATEIPAHIWVNMQAAYNMQTARRDSRLSAMLEQIRKAVAPL